MAQLVSWTDAQRIGALLTRVAPPKRTRPAVSVSPMLTMPPALGLVAPARREGRDRFALVPPIVHVSDNPAERLDALLVWALENLPCVGAFVTGDDGLPLALRGVSESQVALVGPLLLALAAGRAFTGIDVMAGALLLEESMLSWVEVPTERASFRFGVFGGLALPPAAFAKLKEALKTTVQPL